MLIRASRVRHVHPERAPFSDDVFDDAVLRPLAHISSPHRRLFTKGPVASRSEAMDAAGSDMASAAVASTDDAPYTIFDILREKGFDLDRTTVRDANLHVRQWTTNKLKSICKLFTATIEKLRADGDSNAEQLLTSVYSKVLLRVRKPASLPFYGLQPIREGQRGGLRTKPHPLPPGTPTEEEVRIVISFLENPIFTQAMDVPSFVQPLDDADVVRTSEQETGGDKNHNYTDDSDSASEHDEISIYPSYPVQDTQALKPPGVAPETQKRQQPRCADGDADDKLPEQQPAKRSKMQIKPSHQAQAATVQPPSTQLLAAAQPPAATQLLAAASPCFATRSQGTAQPEHTGRPEMAVQPEPPVQRKHAVRSEAARRQVAPPPQHAVPDQEPLPVLSFGDKYVKGHGARRQLAIDVWALALQSLPKSGPGKLSMTTVVGSLGFGYVEDVQYAACEPLEPESSVHLGPFHGLRKPVVTAAEAGVPTQDEKTEVVFCAMAVPYAYKLNSQVYFGAVPMVLYLEERSEKIYLALPSHMADEAAMQRMEVKLEIRQDPTSLDEWRQMAWPSVRRHAGDKMLRLFHTRDGAESSDRFLPVRMDVSPLDLMAGYLQMNMSGGPMQRLLPERPTPHEAAKTLVRDGLRLLYSNHLDPNVRHSMSNACYVELPPTVSAPELDRVHVSLASREGISSKVLQALVNEW
jgi:hypothetical protein